MNNVNKDQVLRSKNGKRFQVKGRELREKEQVHTEKQRWSYQGAHIIET